MDMAYHNILDQLGVPLKNYKGKDIVVCSPVDGKLMASLASDNKGDITRKIAKAKYASLLWREIPAPRRGELIRLFSLVLREHKELLGTLVSMECGKILEEGRGEVQEMIDMCDYALGLARYVGGVTIPSERPQHTIQENWYPLGVVGIITAFNFPVAVWAWNAILAILCGNSVIWKPSEKTPLAALACQALLEKALKGYGRAAPEGLSQIILGGERTAGVLVNHKEVALVSATGSSQMGSKVGPEVAQRFGKVLLELGGNNAAIVTPSADLTVALPSIVFGAVGTAGQRCTTTRRLFVHEGSYEEVWDKLTRAYKKLEKNIGNPLDKGVLMGPLIDKAAYDKMQKALQEVSAGGGKIVGGKRILEKAYPKAFYVQPALVKLKKQLDIVKEETFAPILYVMPYKKLTEAVMLQNAVAQGLSSAIFTTDLREAEYFKSYSDCGIANVNIGTSGAEIGGAFGGEKATGGGREAGSDSWKAYMRRQTSTTYYGTSTPVLAQGITFA